MPPGFQKREKDAAAGANKTRLMPEDAQMKRLIQQNADRHFYTLLWSKSPIRSDEKCNGAPKAVHFFGWCAQAHRRSLTENDDCEHFYCSYYGCESKLDGIPFLQQDCAMLVCLLQFGLYELCLATLSEISQYASSHASH